MNDKDDSAIRSVNDAAMGSFLDFLALFPFRTEQDKAVAAAALFASVMFEHFNGERRMGFVFSGNGPGCGKSTWAGVCAAMISADELGQAPVTHLPGSADEQSKLFTAALEAEVDYLLFDDVASKALNRPVILSFLGARHWRARRLGQSGLVDYSVNLQCFFAGNGLRFSADLLRRVLVCEMDAGSRRMGSLCISPSAVKENAQQVASAYLAYAAEVPPVSANTCYGKFSAVLGGVCQMLGLLDPFKFHAGGGNG